MVMINHQEVDKFKWDFIIINNVNKLLIIIIIIIIMIIMMVEEYKLDNKDKIYYKI